MDLRPPPVSGRRPSLRSPSWRHSSPSPALAPATAAPIPGVAAALQFDGTNDYVTFGDPASLDLAAIHDRDLVQPHRQWDRGLDSGPAGS